MLHLTNSWKFIHCNVRGDANPVDATAYAMNSHALLHVALAKLKTATIQNNTQELDTEDEDDTRN